MADPKSTTKRCFRCGTEKPISEFHSDRSRATGVQVRCKPCQREAKRQYRLAHPDRVRASKRRYRNEHLEQERARDRQRYVTSPSRRWPACGPVDPVKAKERNRRYVAAHPERRRASVNRWLKANYAQALATSARWATANPEKAAAKTRRWAKANPEKAREITRRWMLAHPERVRARARRAHQTRYARKTAAFVEVVDPMTVFDRDGGLCGICKKSVRRDEAWHIDHVIPLAKGGAHSYGNVQLAHARCNCSKGAKVA